MEIVYILEMEIQDIKLEVITSTKKTREVSLKLTSFYVDKSENAG